MPAAIAGSFAQRLAKQRHCASGHFVEMTIALSPASIADHLKPMTRSAVFAPFEIIEGNRERGLVLLADHARRDLPDEYGDLGLPAASSTATSPMTSASRR